MSFTRALLTSSNCEYIDIKTSYIRITLDEIFRSMNALPASVVLPKTTSRRLYNGKRFDRIRGRTAEYTQ